MIKALNMEDDLLGIVTGYEDGTFRPDQPITRLEAVSLVYRALGYLGKLNP